jgi:capsular exopolysaccharide synthesis family protein
MTRIQQILEKAERDGGIARAHGPSDPTIGEPLAFAASDALAAPPRGDGAAEEVAGGLLPGRIVRGARFDPALVSAFDPGGVAAEQYRALRTRVAQAEHLAPLHLIMVTSPGRSEGKSLTAANLGITMAQDFQRRVCIVDADMRHSKLHTLFGISGAPGLSEVLTGRATLAEALIGFDEQQVMLLPAGELPAHPAELLGSSAMRRMIEMLRTHFDRVIVDAPAATPLADVGILAPLVDSVVLVVRAGVTTKPAIHEAVATIGQDKVLGVVLNDAAN